MDDDSILSFYDKLLEKHQFSASAVGWNSEERQCRRFQIIFDTQTSWEAKSILDVGSGLGDFYNFLKCRVSNFDYLGIDANEQMVEFAKRAYPGAEFYRSFFQTYKSDQLFDITVASGLFGVLLDKPVDVFRSFLLFSRKYTNETLILNLLKANPKRVRSKIYCYFDVEEVKEICNNLNLNYSINDFYLDNDFTLVVNYS